jgi:alkylation response protein AidB-like acyl-CoA dehydrogenase
VTEPNAGSDPRRIESSLVSLENQFVLNGSKSWIWAGAWSGVLVTLAKHEQGFTALCLDSNTKLSSMIWDLTIQKLLLSRVFK